MLNEIGTNPMILVHHQKSSPYGWWTSTDTTDDVRMGDRLLRQVYNDLHVNYLEDGEYFSTSKL